MAKTPQVEAANSYSRKNNQYPSRYSSFPNLYDKHHSSQYVCHYPSQEGNTPVDVQVDVQVWRLPPPAQAFVNKKDTHLGI
jgi:hypothetical protein